MTALPAHFQDSRRYATYWFRVGGGELRSFRWFAGEVDRRIMELPEGSVQVEDPFRKGAPLGGYTHNRTVAEVPRGY